MDVLSLISGRYSVRAYREDPLPRDDLDSCLEAARLAPSACNSQPWRFVLADEPELLNALREAAIHRGMNRFAARAPVIAAVFSAGGNLTSRAGAAVKDIPYHYIDIGIAAEHFCLAAAERGIGSCMIGWFDKKRVKRALNAPALLKPVLLITLGRPEGDQKPEKKRKALHEISGWNALP